MGHYTIHVYIEDHYVTNPRRLDPFAIQTGEGNWNYDEITVDICEARKTYELGRDKCHIHIKRSNMTIQAQIWMTFILHNITRVSNTLSINLKTA